VLFIYRSSAVFQCGYSRQILSVIAWFQSSPATSLPAAAFIAKLFPDQLLLSLEDQVRLATIETLWQQAQTIFLRLHVISPSPDLARGLIAHVNESGDAAAWAILLKYTRLSDQHVRTVLSNSGWLNRSSFSNSLLLLLAMFIHPLIRVEVSRRPEFFEILKWMTACNTPTFIHMVCSLLQRTSPDRNYIALISQSGCLGQYLRTTLESPDAGSVRFGIVCVDCYARIGWVEEWNYAVRAIVNILKVRAKDFSDEPILVLPTLSLFPPCLAYMREQGLCDYFTSLLKYEKYAEIARIFLANAARM
jgi:hypothetical protein